jgi:hypothetical protein
MENDVKSSTGKEKALMDALQSIDQLSAVLVKKGLVAKWIEPIYYTKLTLLTIGYNKCRIFRGLWHWTMM